MFIQTCIIDWLLYEESKKPPKKLTSILQVFLGDAPRVSRDALALVCLHIYAGFYSILAK